MYKKILFGTCLTEYCDPIFNFALNLARENNAKLWIYYGLGRLTGSEATVAEAIMAAEAKVAEAYVDRMRKQEFVEYIINVSAGDVASEISKLARNAGIDLMVMGTSDAVPIAAGESVKAPFLGPVISQIAICAPCPVMIVPPALIPGLASG
jgi:nucleotide-binding universal stress UspA family protein